MREFDPVASTFIVIVLGAFAVAAVAFAALGLDTFGDVWRKSKQK